MSQVWQFRTWEFFSKQNTKIFKNVLSYLSNISGHENIYLQAFDTINHDLLLAKLKAYGFSPNALKLMHSYLNNRKQQVQINNKFSSESTVIAGVPQGSIDGPLLFNLFINDLVFFIQYCTLSNYADDNNLFSMGKNKDQVKTFLSSDFKIINNWFYENFMVLNPEKSHFMCIGQKIDDAETLNFNNFVIKIVKRWKF